MADENAGGEDGEDEGLESSETGLISAPASALSERRWAIRDLDCERERIGHERREEKGGILL